MLKSHVTFEILPREARDLCNVSQWASSKMMGYGQHSKKLKQCSFLLKKGLRFCRFVLISLDYLDCLDCLSGMVHSVAPPPRRGSFRVSESSSDLCVCFSPNASAIRGSYFKYRGEGSQIYWIRFGGAVGQGVVRGVVWRLVGDCLWEGREPLETGWHTYDWWKNLPNNPPGMYKTL